MAGLNENGFERKTRDEILSDMQSTAKNLFGSDINLAENSPLGLFIRLISYSLSIVWFTLEKIYNSNFVDTASDQSLDYTAKYIGISRRPAIKATGKVIFKGTEGTTIPEGFVVETQVEPVIQFQTTEQSEINSFGQVEVSIEAVEGGVDGNVASNTITEIVNPISGIDEVNNADKTEDGLDRESDYELRERYYESVAIGGAATIESIKAALLDINGVLGTEVNHNTTMSTVDGMPPKSIECFVYGGENSEIAETIFDSKAAGIEAYGDVSETITDSQNIDHTIKFTRPTEVTIYCDVTLTTDETFPDDGIEKVQTEIIEYVGGIDADGSEYLGLSVGQDVIYTKIISEIHNVEGINDITLYLGVSDNPTGQSNITVASQEVAITSDTEVEVS